MLSEAIETFVVIERLECLLNGIAVGAFYINRFERASVLVLLKDLLAVLVVERHGSGLFRYHSADFGSGQGDIAVFLRHGIFRLGVDWNNHQIGVLGEFFIRRCGHADNLVIDNLQSHFAFGRADNDPAVYAGVPCRTCSKQSRQKQHSYTFRFHWLIFRLILN